MKTPKLIAGFTALVALFAASPAPAEPAAPGTISGRVYNAATKEYVRNAEIRVEGTNVVTYSEDAGYYRLPDVPAGQATVTVSYTGSQPANATVTVPPGGMATHDFELQSMTVTTGGDGIVKLAQFSVSAEREGQAKALMEQRAALNAKSVVASDYFGDVTLGDVGEFLKFMPGISLDYDELKSTTPRIGGLDGKYTTFTSDGTRMASATTGFDTNSRSTTFDQMSITGIESVEVNNTLTASMEADSPAGNINLRTRNSFERKSRAIAYRAYLMGTSDAITLRREYLPDEKKHYKVYPAGELSYADVFLKGRLGVEAAVSYNASFTEQDRNQLEYNYSNPDKPAITGIQWRPGPRLIQRTAGSFGTDYKVAPGLVFSWRSSFSQYQVEFHNQYTWLRANLAQISPDSTLTHVVASATTNANTRLGTEYSHRHNHTESFLLNPKLEYKVGTLTLTARGGYSHSAINFKDMEDGFFRNTNNRVTRIGWIADRPSADSPEWTVTQVRTPGGPDWSNPNDWGSRDTHANNIVSNADKSKGQTYTGNFDAKKLFVVATVPIELKTGLGARLNTYAYKGGTQQWTFVGPTKNQLQAVIPYTTKYTWDLPLGGKAGNINSLGWRIDDTYGTYQLYQQHPDWFVPDTFGNFTRAFTGPRSVKEQIDAAYAEATSRLGRLRLNLGLRGERTRTLAKVWDPRPRAQVVAAGYTVNSAGIANTPEGYVYQYHNGERSNRYGEYNNLFLSGGGKYAFSRNLTGQLSFSESILRPDYNNLSGVTTVDESNGIVSVPNPNLKPETSTKYFASLQYAIEPAGVVSLSAYRLNVQHQLTGRTAISAEQAGYSPDEYPGYTFYSYFNGNGSMRTDGVTAEYSQQLTFLPGAFKGLSVFGSVTRTIAQRQQLRLSPKSANGGVRYRYGRVHVEFRGTWQSARLLSSTFPLNGNVWQAERTLFDLSGGYKLTEHAELMVSIRNIFNTPSTQYSNEPGRLYVYDVYGTIWNVGIKGRF